jgi:hypothetical protein
MIIRKNKRWRYLGLVLLLMGASSVRAQETVFDVPSADFLEKGKVYGELDGTVRPVDLDASFTPRVVVGIGHGIEVGLNFDGMNLPRTDEIDFSPTVKWRMWRNEARGTVFYVGDDLLIPVRKRSYDAGNYFYASFAKSWKHGTRIGAGGYDFTRGVVASGNKTGGQFTFEQQINNRLTLAAEWYTGKHAAGFVNPGAIFKVTGKLTAYAAYQIGNSGVTSGNHQLLWELGYNFN